MPWALPRSWSPRSRAVDLRLHHPGSLSYAATATKRAVSHGLVTGVSQPWETGVVAAVTSNCSSNCTPHPPAPHQTTPHTGTDVHLAAGVAPGCRDAPTSSGTFTAPPAPLPLCRPLEGEASVWWLASQLPHPAMQWRVQDPACLSTCRSPVPFPLSSNRQRPALTYLHGAPASPRAAACAKGTRGSGTRSAAATGTCAAGLRSAANLAATPPRQPPSW
jgi:hypothetical protein